MREFFSFWWRCIKLSARGCTPAANDWQWLVGFPLLAAIIWLVNRWYGEGTLILSQDTTIGVFESALAAFALTWISTFVVKLSRAPGQLKRDANAISFVIGTGKPFDQIEVNQHGVHHTIFLGIKNIGSKKIANCNFYRTYLSFKNNSQKTLLDGPFSLDPDEPRYVPIALFNEALTTPISDQQISLSVPPGGNRACMVPRLPPDQRHALSFAVESTDTGNAVLHCELWVDEAGKLRLEPV